ncbi:MAG TPA: potassium channel protein [Chitinophagaceae bacterium]|nr:potassium channel protein [Chitinophagaceae bacterium]
MAGTRSIKQMAIKSYKLFMPLIIIGVIILTGVIGFMIIEDYSLLDSLYMTIITVTTVGYEEIHELSNAGKVFNILLIISSFATFAYALAKLTQYVVDGEINKFFKNRKIMSAIKELKDHVIVCGYGRNGKQAAKILGHHKVPFVVIESNDERIEQELSKKDILYIKGDATDDDVLLNAGIDKAKALITALPEDADNVYIVLSARSLSSSIQIISRSSNPGSGTKLRKAGADSVISPDKIGGTHMATLVSKPDVIEFIDYLSGEEGESIHLESVGYEILPPELKDRTLQEIMAWRKTGVNCIGIKDAEGKFIINPPEGTLINSRMKVIVLGTRQQIEEMKGNVEHENL